MQYTAIYRRTRNGNITHKTANYPSKKAFAEDLRGNGFKVLEIYAPEQIKIIKSLKYYLINTPAMDYVKQHF